MLLIRCACYIIKIYSAYGTYRSRKILICNRLRHTQGLEYLAALIGLDG